MFPPRASRARDQAPGGQGKRHPAAARHSAAHGRGPAENPARIESARLSHRSRRARDAGTAGDADRAAAMAVASGIGDGGDLALAENSEIRVCQHRSTPRPGSGRPRLAQHRSRPTYAAARARRSLATDNAVAETNDIAAGPHACRTAGSGREHFQDPGIDPRHDAGRAPTGLRPHKRRGLPRFPPSWPANRAATAVRPRPSQRHPRRSRPRKPTGPPPGPRHVPGGTADPFTLPARRGAHAS